MKSKLRALLCALGPPKADASADLKDAYWAAIEAVEAPAAIYGKRVKMNLSYSTSDNPNAPIRATLLTDEGTHSCTGTSQSQAIIGILRRMLGARLLYTPKGEVK
jgi:hypothetical protein